MHIGKIILEKRVLLGLSKVELAEKLGVTERTISRWENEITLPDIYSLKKISDILLIPIDSLFNDLPIESINKTLEDKKMIIKYTTLSIVSISLLCIGFFTLIVSTFSQRNEDIAYLLPYFGFIIVFISLFMFIICCFIYIENYKGTRNYKKHRIRLFIHILFYVILTLILTLTLINLTT